MPSGPASVDERFGRTSGAHTINTACPTIWGLRPGGNDFTKIICHTVALDNDRTSATAGGLKTAVKGYEAGLFGERRLPNEHEVIAGNLGPYPVWGGGAQNYSGSGGSRPRRLIECPHPFYKGM